MHILTKKHQVLSMSKKAFFRGTFLLTCAGLLSRVIGFFYRIFLSHTIGAEGIGLFQLAVPLQTLLLAVTASGIQTALSRLIAAHLATGEDKKARDFFCLGTFFAFVLSCAASALLYLRADFFAVQILKEARTEKLVRILSFSLPFATLHCCVNSYYFARKKTEFPSGLQLIEQIVRVGSSYLLYLVCISEGTPVTAVIAAGGTLVSELVVAVLALLILSLHFQKYAHKIFHIELPFACLKEICRTAFPVTLNRLLLSVLAGIEVVLIPQRLRMYGLSVSESLSIYGIFTGLALPCILFPATITNSASMMLMPSVAEMQALGYQKRIRYVTWQTIRASLLLGVLCAFGFYCIGPFMGTVLFHSPTAGTYIQTLSFVCPFLYLNTTLTSILHGLGQTGRSLVHSALGILVRILFVVFAIPLAGIRGYLYGILFSEILSSSLHIYALMHNSIALPIDKKF